MVAMFVTCQTEVRHRLFQCLFVAECSADQQCILYVAVKWHFLTARRFHEMFRFELNSQTSNFSYCFTDFSVNLEIFHCEDKTTLLIEICKLRVKSKFQSVFKVCVQYKVSEGAAVQAYIAHN
jgi:hypothetical protein